VFKKNKTSKKIALNRVLIVNTPGQHPENIRKTLAVYGVKPRLYAKICFRAKKRTRE
jgi:hypothetical protein